MGLTTSVLCLNILSCILFSLMEMISCASEIFVHLYFTVIDFLRMFVLHPDGATLLLKTIESENGEFCAVSVNSLTIFFLFYVSSSIFLSELSSSRDCLIISSPSLVYLRIAGSNLIKTGSLMLLIHTDFNSFLMLPSRCTCRHFP